MELIYQFDQQLKVCKVSDKNQHLNDREGSMGVAMPGVHCLSSTRYHLANFIHNRHLPVPLRFPLVIERECEVSVHGFRPTCSVGTMSGFKRFAKPLTYKYNLTMKILAHVVIIFENEKLNVAKFCISHVLLIFMLKSGEVMEFLFLSQIIKLLSSSQQTATCKKNLAGL